MTSSRQDQAVPMTPPPPAQPSRRRRTAIIIAAAVLGGVLLGVVAVLLVRPGQPAAPPAQVTAPAVPGPVVVTTPAVSSAAGPIVTKAVGAADGCLGGPNPFLAVVPAQAAATPDDTGAAALARTYLRWSVTYPIDPTAGQVLDQVVTPGSNYATTALNGLNTMAQQMSDGGVIKAEVTPDGSMYRVTSTSADGRGGAELNVIVTRQITTSTGEVESAKMLGTFLMRIVDGHWTVEGLLPPFADAWTAPPTNPWIPYAGAC